MRKDKDYFCDIDGCCRPAPYSTPVTLSCDNRMLDTIVDHCYEHRDTVKEKIKQLTEDFYNGTVQGMIVSRDSN